MLWFVEMKTFYRYVSGMSKFLLPDDRISTEESWCPDNIQWMFQASLSGTHIQSSTLLALKSHFFPTAVHENSTFHIYEEKRL